MDIKNRIKKRCDITNMPIKLALFVYIFIGLFTALLCSLVIRIFFENWRHIIYQVNGFADVADYSGYGSEYFRQTIQISNGVLSQLNFLNQVENILVVACAVIAIACVSHLFYKRKLEEPIQILQTQIQYLGRDDLSFDSSYRSKDEMGQVCTAFNQTRLQLSENKKNLWEIMESQKELNAAFAHDIRTPLTVMKGYIQILSRFYPCGDISEEKLMETLQLLDNQINRMEQFSNTMKEIHTMEEWEVCKKIHSFDEIMSKLQQNITPLSNGSIQIILDYNYVDVLLHCDANLILEVLDNLILNALRYAKTKIVILPQIEMDKLYLYIKDDGSGFTKDALENGNRPYFTTNREHYGLGLTISQTLCKKHGGNLEFMNSIEGGAVVCAYFYIK